MENSTTNSNIKIINLFIFNQLITLIIVGVLIFYVLGAQKEILDNTNFLENQCIHLTENYGFKNKTNSAEIEPCDPSKKSDIPSVLSSILNGSASFDLSGNIQCDWLIGIGIFFNLLLIFYPYIDFIPNFFKVIISFFMLSFEQIKTKRLIELLKENILGKKNTNYITDLLTADTEALEANEQLSKELLHPTNDPTNYPQKGGEISGFKFILELFEKVSELIGKLEGNKCGSGDALRLLFSMIHIIIMLVLGTFLKGYPVDVSSGLFTLFISILTIFLVLGSNIPYIKSGTRIIYNLIGFVCLVTGILLIIFLKGKSWLSPYSIVSASAFIVGLSCFAFASSKDFNKRIKGGADPVNEEISGEISQKLENLGDQIREVNLQTIITGAIQDNEDKQIGGGDRESIACLIFNYFSNLSDSFALYLIKIFIIAIGILFTPNFQKGKLKDILQGLYKVRLSIFIVISCLLLIVFDLIPLLHYLSLLIKKTFASSKLKEQEVSLKESGLYSEISKISFFEICDYNPYETCKSAKKLEKNTT